jgi:hypothetical protein
MGVALPFRCLSAIGSRNLMGAALPFHRRRTIGRDLLLVALVAISMSSRDLMGVTLPFRPAILRRAIGGRHVAIS